MTKPIPPSMINVSVDSSNGSAGPVGRGVVVVIDGEVTGWRSL
ncbi:MAG: hypothetical protein ACFFBL_11005 [Promethearchaeota archaeon]